jgi:hypothetical protein
MIYGAFTSNVDMRTGSPAFGTPESVKAQFASGRWRGGTDCRGGPQRDRVTGGRCAGGVRGEMAVGARSWAA